MKNKVHGVGFNDRSRPANVDGKSVKEYVLWTEMLRRCFSEKHKHINQPTKVVLFQITS